MNLQEYEEYYVTDERHWYISKVKQFNEESINQMARGLQLFAKLLSAQPDQNILIQFNKFKAGVPEQLSLFKAETDNIPISEIEKLFLSLLILSNELVDLKHLQVTNPEKYQLFQKIRQEFLNDMPYLYFVKTYDYGYLVSELVVYYRNFISWLSKFGFFGIEQDRRGFLTDIGWEFADNASNVEATNAIFTHQIKKIQVWNPTIDKKYLGMRVLPYYAILQVLLGIPDHYFSRDEYYLFITKITSHESEQISQAVDLIQQYRKLDKTIKSEYKQKLINLDKERYPERQRTNLDRLSDSSSKEIGAYCYSNLMTIGQGKFSGKVLLTDVDMAREEVVAFEKSTGYIEFETEYDWVRHLGKLDGLNLEEIIELYVRSGKPADEISVLLSAVEDKEVIIQTAKDKLLEKEVEEYYEKKLPELFPNLVIVNRPNYGRQFPTGVGPIDMLCKDVSIDRYFVLEFKRGRVSDETIGQTLRYMGWVATHLARPDENVFGIIVGNRFSDKFSFALAGLQQRNVTLLSLHEHPFTDENRPLLSK